MADMKDITIQGVVFSVMQPYSEGHPITEAEAKALNQVRAENIRNNMASKVKAEQEKLMVEGPEGKKVMPEGAELDSATLSELAAVVKAYDEDYIFTLASAGGGARPKDPIEAEAIKLAKAAVAGMLKKKGVTVKAYTETDEGKEKYENAVAKLADSKDYQDAAKKAVNARNKLSEAGTEELAL
jgi:hypothetical protein